MKKKYINVIHNNKNGHIEDCYKNLKHFDSMTEAKKEASKLVGYIPYRLYFDKITGDLLRVTKWE